MKSLVVLCAVLMLSGCTSLRSVLDSDTIQQRIVVSGITAAVSAFLLTHPEHAARTEEITRKAATLLARQMSSAQVSPFAEARDAVVEQIEWTILTPPMVVTIQGVIDVGFAIAEQRLRDQGIPIQEVRVLLVDVLLSVAEMARSVRMVEVS